MKFSNDVRLNAEIIQHRRKMADRIERAGPAMTAMAVKGKALPGMNIAGFAPKAAAAGVTWLRGHAVHQNRERAR